MRLGTRCVRRFIGLWKRNVRLLGEKPRVEKMVSSLATVNDGKTVGRLRGAFEGYFGVGMVGMKRPSVSKDFPLLAMAVGEPYVMWILGRRRGLRLLPKAQLWDELPSNHSPSFAPVIEPTLRTGVDTLALAVLIFLGIK